MIYEGKAKKIFETDQKNILRIEYKDSLTAFNALKKGSFENKGRINRDIASLIFRYLEKKGISSHWVADAEPVSMMVRKVQIIPLEVVVRNTLAGSTAKKLGIAEGKVLEKPLVEFYYKDDALQDPFLSDDQIEMMQLASALEVKELKVAALKVNSELKSLFQKIDLNLIDFKIEFGRDQHSKILLADEISPDSCRLWDLKTGEKMDKDRFRRDLGGVQEAYFEVLRRLEDVLRKEI